MTVSLVVGRFIVAVMGMVTAALPQSKVMTPPWPTAVVSALSVQLAAVPVPITAVGCDTSAAWPVDGRPALHEPLGFPAADRPPSAPGTTVVPPVPVPSLAELEPQPTEKSTGSETDRTRANDERMRTSPGVEKT